MVKHTLLCLSIVSSAVINTTSRLLNGDTPAQIYDLEVVCDIDPSSTADYCEVIARNDDSTVSGTVLLSYDAHCIIDA